MIVNTTIAFYMLTLAAEITAAAPPSASCGQLPQPYFEAYPSDNPGCLCKTALQHVTISLKPPLKLGAACNLYWANSDANMPINLAQESVTFNQFTQGALPFGRLLLFGHLRLKGKLVYSTSPAGTWWFSPQYPLSTVPTIANLLGSFKLSENHSLEEFGFKQKEPTQVDCMSAVATIEIQDIWLTISDTDEAGAYPSNYRLSKISKFHPCEKN